MRVGVLGAMGRAGRMISLSLVEHSGHDVVLIGRDKNRFEQLQKEIGSVSTFFPSLTVVSIDNLQSLNIAFKDIDMLVIAISSVENLPNIIDAALESKTDCFDILLCSDRKRIILTSYKNRICEAGIVYITDGGYHPGLPAAMARLAEWVSPSLSTINIYSSFGVDWGDKFFSEQEKIMFLKEVLSTKMGFLEEGQWRTGMKIMNFNLNDKTQDFFPVDLDEVQELILYVPTLINTGFFIAGFGRFIDYIMMPIFVLLVKISPRSIGIVAKLFALTLRMLCRNESFALLHLSAEGPHEEVEMTVSYGDAYGLTALPVVALLNQYNNKEKSPGIYRQAFYVNPVDFIDDLQRMGVFINKKIISKK